MRVLPQVSDRSVRLRDMTHVRNSSRKGSRSLTEAAEAAAREAERSPSNTVPVSSDTAAYDLLVCPGIGNRRPSRPWARHTDVPSTETLVPHETHVDCLLFGVGVCFGGRGEVCGCCEWRSGLLCGLYRGGLRRGG
jgi:hypothetical protein